MRGELDPDDSANRWLIRAQYYDAGGDDITYDDVAYGYGGSLTTAWQQKGGTFTVDSGAAMMRARLFNYMNSGWVAYDDVELKLEGSGSNLLTNPGFESGTTGWTAVASSAFPATSFYRGTCSPCGPQGARARPTRAPTP